jgi:4,5-DOPA dioxygenase extradiol
MNDRLPSLFVSHGAPTWALDPGPAGRRLRGVAASLPRPAAVLMVSPHWTTRGVAVTGSAAPRTLHDFGGFDPALHAIRYPAPGHPAIAAAAVDALGAAGFDPRIDATRGLDHGAWVPMLHLYPGADVPVVQVSMPHGLDADGALRLGRAIAPLAAQRVLIVGSGSMTHNLHEVFGRVPPDDVGYVDEFVGWVRETVRADDLDRLSRAMALAPHAARAHPTDEHFLPLLVAAAAGPSGAPVEIVDGGTTYGTLSMDAIVFGLGGRRAGAPSSGGASTSRDVPVSFPA